MGAATSGHGSHEPMASNDAGPIHRVRVDGFWMDETDVTNDQFAAFVAATGYVTTAEKPVDWTERPVINPGPFQFHGDADHVRRWMAARGYLFCRRGEVREIMRPIPIPGDTPRWGLCDGIHRDEHEFIPA